MAGVLIEMRAAILRRSTSGKRVIGSVLLALFVTLLAVGTLLTGLAHYHYSGAAADVIATLSFGWLLGWVSGPLLTGDDSTLRMDYFKLLPIPAVRLARGILGASFANPSLFFSLIAFRLTMSPRGRSRAYRAGSAAGRPLLPLTPLGAAVGKELRLYSRSVLRSVMIMIAFLVGVLTAVIPAFGGKTVVLPFGGLLFTTIAAACFTNFYGDDGSAMWLTLVVPGAERPDIRGRQWAWFLVVGPAGLLLTVVLTAVSGQAWAWPWVLAGEPALVIGSTGLLALISVASVQGPAPDGGPTPQRALRTHLALIAVPSLTLFPALALLIAGSTAHQPALTWLAVPAGIGWAALLCLWSSRAAEDRLITRGPEIFALVSRKGI